MFNHDWLGFKLSDFIGCCGCYTPWVNRNRFAVTTAHREERAAQVCFFPSRPTCLAAPRGDRHRVSCWLQQTAHDQRKANKRKRKRKRQKEVGKKVCKKTHVNEKSEREMRKIARQRNHRVVLRGCACIRAYACGFHVIVVVIVVCCC